MNIPRFDLRSELAAATSGAAVEGHRVLDDEPPASYEHVFRFVSQAAWAITPEVLAVIKDMLTYRMAGHRLSADELGERIGRTPYASQGEIEAARRGAAPARRGAVALMSMYGVIAPRASMVNNLSGPSGTGLDEFGRQLRSAVEDPEVASVVVDINSPGGTVDMVPETAQLIRESRDRKPIYGVANTDAGSAAYWLGSQMSELSVTPSGMVGSIGVYSAHQDISVANEMAGKRVSLISAGKFKVEGNPFEPLSEEARAAVQSVVDGYYNWFVEDVARGRSVKASVVRDGYGQGRMLMAKQALAEGMVDRIETLSQTVDRAMRGGGRSRAVSSEATLSEDLVTVATDEAELEATEAPVPVDHFPFNL